MIFYTKENFSYLLLLAHSLVLVTERASIVKFAEVISEGASVLASFDHRILGDRCQRTSSIHRDAVNLF